MSGYAQKDLESVKGIMLKYFAKLEKEVYFPAMKELAAAEEEIFRKYFKEQKTIDEATARGLLADLKHIEAVKNRMTSRLESIRGSVGEMMR